MVSNVEIERKELSAHAVFSSPTEQMVFFHYLISEAKETLQKAMTERTVSGLLGRVKEQTTKVTHGLKTVSVFDYLFGQRDNAREREQRIFVYSTCYRYLQQFTIADSGALSTITGTTLPKEVIDFELLCRVLSIAAKFWMANHQLFNHWYGIPVDKQTFYVAYTDQLQIFTNAVIVSSGTWSIVYRIHHLSMGIMALKESYYAADAKASFEKFKISAQLLKNEFDKLIEFHKTESLSSWIVGKPTLLLQTHSSRLSYIRDYYDGNLCKLIKKKLKHADLLNAMKEVIIAFKAVTDLGLIVNDIKPNNILFYGKEGTFEKVRICDLEGACMADQLASNPRATYFTKGFYLPSDIETYKKLKHSEQLPFMINKIMVYAIAVTIYYCLSNGNYPYSSEQHTRHDTFRAGLLIHFPLDLSHLLALATHFDHDNRPTLDEFHQQFLAIQYDENSKNSNVT